jgi:hypothetical protein
MLRALIRSFKPAADPAAARHAPAPAPAAPPAAFPTAPVPPVASPAGNTPPPASTPDFATTALDAANARAQAAFNAGTADAAITQARARLAEQPRDLATLLELTGLLFATHPQEALELHARAVALHPLSVPLLLSMAHALQALQRYEDALAYLRLAIAARAPSRELRFEFSMLLFLCGHYREGFLHFSTRNPEGPVVQWPWREALPQWQGEPLAGRGLLVWTDWGGLGDELLFARYLPLLRERAGPKAVYLRCTAQNRRLFSRLEGVTEAFDQGGVLPIDCHVALLDLPAVFGTDRDCIPAPVPYLHADARDRARWKARLAPLPGLKVGLCWGSGFWNMGSAADRDGRQMKSMRLEHLRELCAIPGISFVSLQKGMARDELASCDLPIADFDADLKDMADTAALASELDLVITVDTSVSHLAGGLGCPTLVLMPFSSGSFWLTRIETSPWYPTARLLRQAAPGDWAGVAARAAQQLRGVLQAGRVDVFAGIGAAPQDAAAGEP